MSETGDQARISRLERDVAQVSVLVPRFDVALEKLSEVATNVSKLLAVHEARLDHQDKVGEQLTAMIESHRREDNLVHAEMHEKINSVRDELKKEQVTDHQAVMKKLDEMQTDNKKQHDETNKKVGVIEKWMWVASGGAAVIGFFGKFLFDYFTKQ